MLISFRYGIGVSSDGVRNLSTADNIANGNGFIDMTKGAFTWWPPLYPLLLAGLSFFTSRDVFLAASWLNIGLFVLNLYLWGILFFNVFKDKWIYAVISGLVLIGSRSNLRLYANVLSEPLFITLMLLFIFFAARYLKDEKSSNLWWMFLTASIACLQRYTGVALIALAVLLGLFKNKPQKWWQVVSAAFFSSIPLFIWIYFHNYLQYGLLFGPRNPEAMLPLQNISLMLTKSLNWFMPLHPLLKPLMLKPWLILLPVFAILVVFNKKENWAAWVRSFTQNNYVVPIVLFAVLHNIILIFTVNTLDHRDLTSDRYYATTMPAVLIMALLTFDNLVLSCFSSRNTRIRTALILLFAIWLIYPFVSMQEYIHNGIMFGESSNYNMYNKRIVNEKPILVAARSIAVEHPQIDFYSNNTSLGWFHLRRPFLVLPREDPSMKNTDQIAQIKQNYPNWLSEEGAYVIWFLPADDLRIAPPKHLKFIANLELLYSDTDGEIYYVKPLSVP